MTYRFTSSQPGALPSKPQTHTPLTPRPDGRTPTPPPPSAPPHAPTVPPPAIPPGRKNTRLPTHINIRAADTGLAKDSVVLLEQIRTLDKHRLRQRAGQITPEDQKRVNQALDVSLGLDSY